MGLFFVLVKVSKREGRPIEKETGEQTHILVKKLKKEVINEVEQDIAPVKYSTQKVEEPEGG